MKSELLQPFGYLSDSINFWRLTIPGQDGGVSVRCEMYATMRDGQLLAWPVPAAKPLVSAGAEWTLENLIYMAGLPIRADLALVKNKNTNPPRPVASVDELQNLGADRLDFHLLEGKWNAIMQPLPVSNLPITVAREWLMLAERTFVDEVNNFPGIMIGTPPSASPDSDEKLRYDNSRDGAPGVFLLDHIDAAPRGNAPPITIRNPPDRAVGHLWLLNDDWAFRNRSLIVALSNVPFGRALHTEDGVLVRLYVASQDQKGEMSGLPVQPVADRNSLALAPLPATRIVLADTWRALVHELGHSFGLGDEYTERAETFQGPESDLDQFGNLTMPQTFINPDGTLHLSQIKWNWHRIRNASVINQITEDGTSGQFPTSKRYKLHIHPQSFPWYGKGVNVLVRSRQRFVVINRTTKVSGPYIIEDVSAAGDVLTLEPMQGNTDLAGFLAGSIVFEPVPDVFPSTSLHRHLVSPAAERIMQAIRGTMTGAACVVSDQMARPDVEESTPLKADPLGRVTSKNLSRLVGAHFGGRLFACGVVHPSGHCMMRRGTDDSSSFCHVCRYVLVEQIAPEKHWLIDLDYDKEYPL
jgi:hypothetical protein